MSVHAERVTGAVWVWYVCTRDACTEDGRRDCDASTEDGAIVKKKKLDKMTKQGRGVCYEGRASRSSKE